MKKYIYIAIVIVIILLICGIFILGYKVKSLQNEVSDYAVNFEALNLENTEIKNQAIAYKFDIEQLEYINDSIIKDLNTTRKQLKIKDKELLLMQNIKTETTIKDTILIRDTVLKNAPVLIDTTIGNQWYTLKVNLTSNKLSVHSTYKSDLKVFAKSSKEILGTPKKCFIGRLFQKKHKVVRVEVVDENPYSEIKSKKFVIIE